jgi:GTPase SAR1 family protein
MLTAVKVTQNSPTVNPSLVKLLNIKSWRIDQQESSQILLSNNYDFKVVSVIGSASSGKSSLMNRIAGQEVFPTHVSSSRGILKHLTEGIDMFAVKSRLILLDSQGLMSPSILDDFIGGSSPIPCDSFTETEVLSITSMQIISFLLSISDSLIITVNHGFIDPDFLQMLSTCISIMSSSQRQLNLIWFLNQKVKKNQFKEIEETLEIIYGRGNITVINDCHEELKKKIFSMNTGRESKKASLSETSWLKSCQVFWDKLVRKPSLFLG